MNSKYQINTTPPISPTHPKYRPDIDGLRAIAVLSVVFYHAFPNWLPGGFIGVDIFFVISGFLISTIIFNSLKHDSFSFFEFYSRRICRIFPALIVVLISCYTFGWFVLLANEYKQLGKHIAAGAGFVSNFVLWSESSYFDTAAATKPLLHLWSLGIEEQFYIIWPLLLWVAWKKKFNLFTISLILIFISFGLNLSKYRIDGVANFYSPQTRFWELLAGSLFAYITNHNLQTLFQFRERSNAWLEKIIYAEPSEIKRSTFLDVQSLFGALLIVFSFIYITHEKNFPGVWAILPVVGTVFIIMAGAHSWFNRLVLSNPILVWFGIISFPLYLWHWPLLSFARIIEGQVPNRTIRISAVLVAMILAWLTYKIVERPIRFSKDRIHIKSILLTTIMIIIGYIGYNTSNRDGLPFRDFNKKFSTDIGGFLDYKTTLKVYGLGKCLIDYDQDLNTLLSEGCVSNDSAKPRFIVFGDSEAAHLISGFREHIPVNYYHIDQWTGTSCRVFSHLQNDDKRCSDFSRYFIKTLLPKFNANDTIIIGGNWIGSHYRLGRAEFAKLIDAVFNELSVSKAKIVVFGDTPEFNIAPNFRLISRKTRLAKENVYLRSLDYRDSNSIIQEKSLKFGFRYFNPSAALCKADDVLECLVFDGKSMTVFDGGHLSETGSRIVIANLISSLELL